MVRTFTGLKRLLHSSTLADSVGDVPFLADVAGEIYVHALVQSDPCTQTRANGRR
jgi:hypothetical protein